MAVRYLAYINFIYFSFNQFSIHNQSPSSTLTLLSTKMASSPHQIHIRQSAALPGTRPFLSIQAAVLQNRLTLLLEALLALQSLGGSKPWVDTLLNLCWAFAVLGCHIYPSQDLIPHCWGLNLEEMKFSSHNPQFSGLPNNTAWFKKISLNPLDVCNTAPIVFLYHY